MSITHEILSYSERKLIADGFRHMVDNGYGKLDGVDAVLKVIAADIETHRREIRIGQNAGFDVTESLNWLAGKEARLRNFYSRTRGTT